jgi:histidyl-tRNA synthetase
MVPDAEVIKVFAEILIELDLGIPFKIKLNSRKILDAII